MSRDLSPLTGTNFDVLVVGGGIHGACTAWEAARLGLRVALIERGDFGAGTSCNSLRTLHGGLRYLQHLDFARMRQSIYERREWLRLAPHLTQPMRFVLPTRGLGLKGPYALRAALLVNDLVSADRNHGVPPRNHLPRGEILSAVRTQTLLAGTQVTGINGGAAWYDGVCTNTERLLWEVVAAAVTAGALAFNYVEADELLLNAGRVSGVRATDRLGAQSLTVRAAIVVNAAGPWVDEWLPTRSGLEPMFHASYGFNLLTRPFAFPDAIGFAVPRGSRAQDTVLDQGTNTYFILPWNGQALIGTRHLRCAHANRGTRVPPGEIAHFLAELNVMLGEHRLRGEDIRGVFSGLLPEVRDSQGTAVVLDKSARVLDHGPSQGVHGLLSVLGVKWTTARWMGERAALRAAALLRGSRALPTKRSLPAIRTLPPLRADWMHAIQRQNPALTHPLVEDLSISGAQIVYAARHEMAVQLSDAARRRQPLYLSAHLDLTTLRRVAQLMAPQRQWSASQIQAQAESALHELQDFRGSLVDLP